MHIIENDISMWMQTMFARAGAPISKDFKIAISRNDLIFFPSNIPRKSTLLHRQIYVNADTFAKFGAVIARFSRLQLAATLGSLLHEIYLQNAYYLKKNNVGMKAFLLKLELQFAWLLSM